MKYPNFKEHGVTGKPVLWVHSHKRKNELHTKETDSAVFVEYPGKICAYDNIHYPKPYVLKILRENIEGDILKVWINNDLCWVKK